MRHIRSKNTKPELYLRSLLHGAGFRYSLITGKIPGHPDLWMPKWNLAIFVHGCFWHRHNGCKYAYNPKTNTEFWCKKFSNNINRDRKVGQLLEEARIRRLVVWECSIKNALKSEEYANFLLLELEEFIKSNEMFMEI